MTSYRSYKYRRESKTLHTIAWIIGGSAFMLLYAWSWTWVL